MPNTRMGGLARMGAERAQRETPRKPNAADRRASRARQRALLGPETDILSITGQKYHVPSARGGDPNALRSRSWVEVADVRYTDRVSRVSETRTERVSSSRFDGTAGDSRWDADKGAGTKFRGLEAPVTPRERPWSGPKCAPGCSHQGPNLAKAKPRVKSIPAGDPRWT